MNIIKVSNIERVDVRALLAMGELPVEFHEVGAIALRAAYSSERVTQVAGRQVCELLAVAGELLVGAPLLMPEGAEKMAAVRHPDIPRYTFTRTLKASLGQALARRLNSPVAPAEGRTVQAMSLAYYEKTTQPEAQAPDQYVFDLRAYLDAGEPIDAVSSTLTVTPGPNYATMTLAKGLLSGGETIVKQHDPSFTELRNWRLALRDEPLLAVPLQRGTRQ